VKEYRKGTVHIRAGEIEIGEGVTFGKDIDIVAKDRFAIGDRSRLGDNIHIRGRNIIFGKDLYHSEGLRIGGGGCDRPRANFSIGDRCTIHSNHINIAEPVTIGNDVGLSPEVTLYTHFFWLSVLKGFPAGFEPIHIDSGAIIGYRTTILPGVLIGENAVVGAHSVVTKNVLPWAVYAGNPARFIRDVRDPTEEVKEQWLQKIIIEFVEIAEYHGHLPLIQVDFPWIKVNECMFNVDTLQFIGEEDMMTDGWRDHARRYGLRWYSKRPFKSMMDWETT